MEACAQEHVDGSMGMGGCRQEGMDRSMQTRACRHEQLFWKSNFKKHDFLMRFNFYIGMKQWGEEWLFVLLSVCRLHIFVGLEECRQIPHKQIVVFRKFWKEWNVEIVDPNATFKYPMTKYSCYHPTSTIPTGKKNCPDATILTLPFWCFLSKATLQMPPSKC